jgi:hypothetical protein
MSFGLCGLGWKIGFGLFFGVCFVVVVVAWTTMRCT